MDGPRLDPAVRHHDHEKLQAKSIISNICSGIGVRGGVGFNSVTEFLPQPVQVMCADVGKSAGASKTPKVIPPSSASGPIYFEVDAGDGPLYTYRYKAAPRPGCRRVESWPVDGVPW